ncbi:alcohol dehydrogenase catalytic domain-containing protein [Micromonospora echinofusca]|uniref:Alcohol dehydrogenase catalytic domain-containing protein n=1 Tax=Micromonospora echinofusca TaxID=47858 RepID=A0ABS3VME5_MICEH|nr:alcohol dehydrogenase catalytic domain-containing protein [Micromonospora echinofusca]MBO4205549.1 alcohol dehydrogenase catalytic domain-containing protein [Micromonospora echinofusca]
MRAVVLDGPGQLAAERVDDPTPTPDGVVVAVRDCGICGTDLHLVDGDLGTDRFPLVPGHEPWGEVVAVGRDVTGYPVGTLVAVDPSLHCGRCDPCRRGHGNMCLAWGAVGATRPGAWAEYTAVPAANLYRLDESFPLAAAPLAEPVACAVRGLHRLAPRPDEPAVVFGAGTMGLILAILLDARGVGPVTLVDTNPARRELAARLTGARVTDPDGVAGHRVPWVIEATGSPSAFTAALDCVARAGHLLVFGVAAPEATAGVSPYRIYADELTILGSMAILRSFPAAVDTLRRHADRLAPLVTDRFPLADVAAALALVRSGRTVKTLLTPGLGG